MNHHVAIVIGAAAFSLFGAAASAEVAERAQTYDKVLVDEIELSFDAASPLKSLNESEAKRIREAARAAITSAAQGHYTIVTESAPGVIRVHATISDVDAAKKDKHLWRFTPVGAIKNRVDAASGADFVVRAAIVDVAAFDALSGEPLGAPIAAPASDNGASVASLREVLVALDAKVRRLFTDANPQAREEAPVDGATETAATVALR